MRLIKGLISRIKLLKTCKEFSKHSGYYDECERKSRRERYKDLRRWAHKWKEFNIFYYAYGLDVKGAQIDNYLGYNYMKNIRDNRNNAHNCESPAFLLRNKFYFSLIAKQYHWPIPKTLGLYENGAFFDENHEKTDISTILSKPCIFKDVTGLCGTSVYVIKSKSDLERIMTDDKEKHGSFLVQELVEQHHLIATINSRALNTVRLMTVKRENGQCELIGGALRVGTNQSEFVDNWAKGGLLIPIDIEKGILTKWGFYKPPYGGKSDKHPDSGICFENFPIPFFKEAKELVCQMHECLNLYSIGWDIAITENGPVVIEGNDNWDLALGQIAVKGFKNKLWH